MTSVSAIAQHVPVLTSLVALGSACRDGQRGEEGLGGDGRLQDVGNGLKKWL